MNWRNRLLTKHSNHLLPIAAISLPIVAMFLFVVWFLAGTVIANNFDLLVDNGSYAPYFNLKDISRGAVLPGNFNHPVVEDDFSFKSEATQTGRLFVKFAPTGSVFVYDSAANKMKLSSLDEWNKSLAEASTYSNNRGAEVSGGTVEHSINLTIAKKTLPTESAQAEKKWRFNYNLKGYDLTKITIPTRGRSGWKQLISPINDTRIATLTFDGKQSGGNGFLFGEKLVVPGTRYVEIFQVAESSSPDAPEVRKIGRTYKLYDPEESTKLNITWTKDDQFIVVWATDSSIISIIKVEN